MSSSLPHRGGNWSPESWRNLPRITELWASSYAQESESYWAAAAFAEPSFAHLYGRRWQAHSTIKALHSTCTCKCSLLPAHDRGLVFLNHIILECVALLLDGTEIESVTSSSSQDHKNKGSTWSAQQDSRWYAQPQHMILCSTDRPWFCWDGIFGSKNGNNCPMRTWAGWGTVGQSAGHMESSGPSMV